MPKVIGFGRDYMGGVEVVVGKKLKVVCVYYLGLMKEKNLLNIKKYD